jgi:hypothetical protein
LLGIFFHPEDAGIMFLQNVGLLNQTALNYAPEDKTIQELSVPKKNQEYLSDF